jgi:hypothetical protein
MPPEQNTPPKFTSSYIDYRGAFRIFFGRRLLKKDVRIDWGVAQWASKCRIPFASFGVTTSYSPQADSALLLTIRIPYFSLSG